ncbi:hypothetical protein NUU61_002824 [Penicillium alfredii]|uniref:Uncharacterized protein n=1 Tax=Penicillium alfredii TaxID=1506179 RepID=A0A9W9FSD8_9EURO|nr:uncharacterized protein NUU61_002824 [Penicillium alfredii]KAJ5105477.1 hypothetical protein NUU61_002824 [Penicillium alfredii]
MSDAGVDSVKWISRTWNRKNPLSSSRKKRRRISQTLLSFLAIDLDKDGFNSANKKKLKKLQKILAVPKQLIKKSDLPTFCNDDFRTDKGPNNQEHKINGEKAYWDTIWKLWSVAPTCKSMSDLDGYMSFKENPDENPGTAERLVICPSGFGKPDTLSQLRSKGVQEVIRQKVELDDVSEYVALTLFHELLHSQAAGYLEDYNVHTGESIFVGNSNDKSNEDEEEEAIPAYGQVAVPIFAESFPDKAMNNADSVALYAAAMYLHKWSWWTGEAQIPDKESCDEGSDDADCCIQ